MKVFVTGAAGFVGSRLAKALLERGDTVVGHDNFDPYYDRAHKVRHLRDLLTQPNFMFIEGDIRNAEQLRQFFHFQRPDAVAHMAGMAAVRYSMDHPLVYAQTNVQGTMHLLDAARAVTSKSNQIIRCVLASTGSVYGTSTPVPFKEDAPADRPLAPYPASKRAMELMAHCYHHLWKLPTTVVRFFNVYGPFGRPDMMPWQWTLDILSGKPLTLYNGGHIRRDWTYIDDIVAGLMLALDQPPASGYEIVNLGCSSPVENLRFVEVLEGLLGKKAQIVDTPTPPTEPMITYADISKAREMLGYEPKVKVEEGLANFVKWMKAEKIIS